MNKKQLKIPSHSTSIKTHVQAGFHLDRGETLALPISWTTSIFIKKNKEEEIYDLALVPMFGQSRMYTGDFKAVCSMIDDYEFMVLKKANLVDRKPGLLDKILNIAQWFSRLKGRK